MSLKSFLFKEEEPPKEAPKVVATTVKPSYPPVGIVGATSFGVEPIGAHPIGDADEFSKYFQDIMDKANLPGPDYYEFSKALDSMKGMPLSDQQRFVTVFAGFAAQGVKPQALVDAANQYLNILNQKKESEFEASVKAAQGQVDQKKQKIEQLTKENADLTAKIQQNTTDMMTLNNEVMDMQGKLESKKTTFAMSFQNFTQKILADIEKIKTYLINGNATQ